MARRINESAKASPPTIVRISTNWKLAISGLLLFHLLAVVAEPFALFTRGANGTSPAATAIRRTVAPYVEMGYLNHGYFFFAPNPGPSHLLECNLKSAGGEQSRLRLPDLRAQWPRLLYHRHFMLAEFLHQLHVDPISEQEVANAPNKELAKMVQSERQLFETVRNSMIKHLKERYGFDSAEIFRLEHRLPTYPEVFVDKIPLNDERLYLVLPDAPIYPPVTPTPIQGGASEPETLPLENKGSKPILNPNVRGTEQVSP